MPTFLATNKKFDPETDSSRAPIGLLIDYEGSRYKVEKVSHIALSELIRKVRVDEPDFDPTPYDRVIMKSHPTRSLYWLVWVSLQGES